jgi:hypothetical protein
VHPVAAAATEGGKALMKPRIDLLNDDPELFEDEFVGFTS